MGISYDDWVAEDLTTTMVRWHNRSEACSDPAANTEPCIFTGFSVGLDHLLKLTPPNVAGVQLPKETIVSMLNRLSPRKVSISGHSLGGALAPILALYLKETMDSALDLSITIFAGP